MPLICRMDRKSCFFCILLIIYENEGCTWEKLGDLNTLLILITYSNRACQYRYNDLAIGRQHNKTVYYSCDILLCDDHQVIMTIIIISIIVIDKITRSIAIKTCHSSCLNLSLFWRGLVVFHLKIDGWWLKTCAAFIYYIHSSLTSCQTLYFICFFQA